MHRHPLDGSLNICSGVWVLSFNKHKIHSESEPDVRLTLVQRLLAVSYAGDEWCFGGGTAASHILPCTVPVNDPVPQGAEPTTLVVNKPAKRYKSYTRCSIEALHLRVLQ
jgi:hypothetical protein